MVRKEEKYKIISSILKERFGLLHETGYRVVLDKIEIIYLSIEVLSIIIESGNRKISFSYTEKNIREEVFDNFNIMISKDEYNGFDFLTYIKTIGIKSPEEKMKLINYEGDFKERLEKFCEFVKGVFTNQLSKVISGEEWINVGFDWGPYK